MKNKILLVFAFLILASNLYSQSYLGFVKKKTNLREDATSESSILLTLKAGTQIFIESLDTYNGFYSVIDIETNTEGYIAESYITIGEVIEKSKDQLFSPSGKISGYDPQIQVFNNTNLNLTLKINESVYQFSPRETSTLNISPGFYEFRASAPGVIPTSGSQNLEGNMGYSWEFYVVTR